MASDEDATAGGKRLLSIYLNDQLAAGVLWRELARRSRASNEGTELGAALEEVASAIAEDVETFRRMMGMLGIPRGRLKPALAVVAERVGRLKLNGSLTGYSPLSRFVELEALVMGIEGKKVLWQTVGDIAGVRARLPQLDFDELIARADAQRRRLEPFRVEAGRRAFAPDA
jgi:hypothetical protein